MAAAVIGPNVLNELHSQSAAAFSQHMIEIRANASLNSYLTNASAVKQFDEPGAAESRAIDKVLNLPK